MKIQTTNTIFKRGDLARKVSVIVPLHNYAYLIEQTLATVAAQSLKDIALIVVDDASTDDSLTVVERWMRDDAPDHLACVLLTNVSNAGLSVTRNTGIAQSRSEYCFFLDADNLLFPRCLEKHVRALDARQDCVGAYSILEEFGSVSQLIGANVFDKNRLKKGNYIDAMTMLRRDAIERLEGFLPIKHGWEDYELWLRLCEAQERLLHLPEVLSRYRHHQKSMLRQQTNVGQNIDDLHRNIEQLHPWVQLAAPDPQRPAARVRGALAIDGANAARKAPASNAKQRVSSRPGSDEPAARPVSATQAPAKTAAGPSPYKAYQDKLFSRLEALSAKPPRPVNVEIDTDYTGLAYDTAFEVIVSERQRADTVKQIERMLSYGIVAINPAPGVHAARQENGDFLRYTSILAKDEPVCRLPSSMLIHIHAFYPDVVEEILEYFVDDAVDGRFLITTTTTKNFDEIIKIVEEKGFASAETILVENSGRDIGPFLDHAIDYASDGDVICHIHTKKSPAVGPTYGALWRKSLYGALLTQTAVDAFDDERLGLLFPDSSRPVGWGKNRSFCENIAKNFGFALPAHPGPMPIGNMFFAKVEVARAMQAATSAMPWPREPVPYDGTVLHAIERMWVPACQYAGFDWAAIHAYNKAS
ncbi:hypothetical protein ASE49_08645 [Novosphingobium sp. Leaf2]|nr:hypothetical protein ASE49_08645 [Novosphingobium sp. Leaf2]